MTPERLRFLRTSVRRNDAPYDDELKEALDAYEAERHRAERAEALLRDVEWQGDPRCARCPACGIDWPLKPRHHAIRCELAAIIGAKVAT